AARCELACVAFFFFQAEDGIRDFHVTGVQTCALPIYIVARGSNSSLPTGENGSGLSYITYQQNVDGVYDRGVLTLEPGITECYRSEERRVGERCRSWGLTHDVKKDREDK